MFGYKFELVHKDGFGVFVYKGEFAYEGGFNTIYTLFITRK